MSECLIYYLKEGLTHVGKTSSNQNSTDIVLNVDSILPEHCVFENVDGKVSLTPRPDAACYVNGQLVTQTTPLVSGNRVILGKNHVFRFQNRREQQMSGSKGPEQTIDWSYAYSELLEKQGIDMRKEMQEKLQALEDQYRREREDAEIFFQKQKQDYERKILSLQQEVEMSRSMMSSSMLLDQSTFDDSEPSRANDFDDTHVMNERELQLASWAFRKWRYHQHTSLQVRKKNLEKK